MKKLIPLLPTLLLSGCLVTVAPGTETNPSPSSSATTRPPIATPITTPSGSLAEASIQVGVVASDAAVLPLERNMARLPGVVVATSSDYPSWPKPRLTDGKLETSWFTASGDAANLGKTPFIDMTFPQPVKVTSINLRGNREYKDGYDILEGRLTVNSTNGKRSFDIVLPQPDRDFSLRFAFPVSGVTAIRFDITKDESADPGLAELEVEGNL
ncbi:MAG: hypothetical protein CVV27_18650 [Candidatus Melainabacteria bacterium HGW-Melainabacteria-1]|nr:MAG: hypothetical protein CVV27_18650 [Candidatus Melainabacteria bacterium HGW-Melainabacteria-1]